MRATKLADREPLPEPLARFLCGLAMVLCEMHYRLSSRIYKNGAQRSASGAVFPGYEWSIPNIRADFLTFALKSVDV